MKKYLIIITIVISQNLLAETSPKVDLVVTGLEVPWGLEFLSTNQILFTEKQGKLKVLDIKSKKIKNIKGIPEVYDGGQGGLLDVKLHPEYSKNNLIFFTYSKKNKKGKTTALARAKLDSKYKLSDLKTIFIAYAETDKNIHFGSRILFFDNETLFISVGDRGFRDRAQDLNYHNGKVLRLDTNGKAKPDNPFVNKKGALPEIWSLGHRNPQGLTLDPLTRKIYEVEHGPRGGDEINLIEKGKNYGWPVITYGKEYWGPKIGEGTKKEGLEQPLKYYIPSIAPCGSSFYRGDKYPYWSGKIIIGALALKHLNVVELNKKNEKRYFESLDERIRDVEISPDGFIYFSTDSGKIYKIVNP